MGGMIFGAACHSRRLGVTSKVALLLCNKAIPVPQEQGNVYFTSFRTCSASFSAPSGE